MLDIEIPDYPFSEITKRLNDSMSFINEVTICEDIIKPILTQISIRLGSDFSRNVCSFYSGCKGLLWCCYYRDVWMFGKLENSLFTNNTFAKSLSIKLSYYKNT